MDCGFIILNKKGPIFKMVAQRSVDKFNKRQFEIRNHDPSSLAQKHQSFYSLFVQ
jgi:hypothetical protein